MEIINIGTSEATVRLTRHELVILSNAVNETREALEDWEFSPRVGATVEETEDVQSQIRRVLNSMQTIDRP